jgi:hypothetical protein
MQLTSLAAEDPIMTTNVFYALHYDEDRSRAACILESATVSPNSEATLSEWAQLKRSGDFAIQSWIETQLKGRSCMVVLIGAHTTLRPWVHYEIRRSRQLKTAMIGVHIHRLADAQGNQSAKGENPFEHPESGLGSAAKTVRVYDPPEADAQTTYQYIADNLMRWTDEAVADRRHWQ